MTRAVRALAARPGLTITAVATLALGLGVNAAIFSLTRAMLFRPIPYREGDRLAIVFETNQPRGMVNVPPTPFRYFQWRERVTAFEQTAVFQRAQFNVADASSAVQVEGFRVDANYFPMLGITPALGRGFTADETRTGNDDVVLLTDGFWRRHFGADGSIVGRRVAVDGTPCTIIGVLPPTFRLFRVLNREVDVFRPWPIDRDDREHALNIWARVAAGATIGQARAQLAAAYASMSGDEPADAGWSATADLLSDRFGSYSRSILPILEAAVGFVLLIGCANVANLLLAAAAGRRQELAIRAALGAGRWRIALDLAGESVVLVSLGVLVAAILAAWIVAVCNSAISYTDLNRSEPFAIDAWVFGYLIAVAALVALAFALLPASAAGAVDVTDALKDSSHASSGQPARRLRQALVVGELAMSIVLAASAGVLAKSTLALHDLPRGLRSDGVMTAQVALTDPRYAEPGRLVRVTTDVVDRLRLFPGVESAAVVNYAPLSIIGTGVPVVVDGYTPPSGTGSSIARYWVIGPQYFRTVGMSVIAGRDFSETDDAASAGVAIVSDGFVRRFWPGASAIGRLLRTDFPRSNAFWIPRSRRGDLTVVGVVGDVREDGVPNARHDPQMYLPYAQNPTIVATLLARSSTDRADAAAAAIRAAVAGADPQLPVSYEMSLDDVARETFARPREAARLIGAFALLAFVLAAVGVYGVMAQSTAARANEIAIRMAIGATRADIVALIVGQAMTLTALGVVIGVAATPLALRLASGLLFGVGPFDPWTLAGVAAGLAGVSGCAAAIPAYRAGANVALSR